MTFLRRRLGRLSYANVMATLALFFALTGTAAAGVKYLTTSDVIPSTSDLGASTYGNPLIAAGKVTSGKIADGAITSSKFDSAATAPNASQLKGHGLSDFPIVVARGSFTRNDTVLPGVCSFEGGGLSANYNPATDVAVVVPPQDYFESEGLTISPTEFERSTGSDPPAYSVGEWWCNSGTTSNLVSGTFTYLVLR